MFKEEPAGDGTESARLEASAEVNDPEDGHANEEAKVDLTNGKEYDDGGEIVFL